MNKDVFWPISGMMAQKNEGWILAEPARAAQFGKSRGGWQNTIASTCWPLFAVVP
jgi:hypothetical protein